MFLFKQDFNQIYSKTQQIAPSNLFADSLAMAWLQYHYFCAISEYYILRKIYWKISPQKNPKQNQG